MSCMIQPIDERTKAQRCAELSRRVFQLWEAKRLIQAELNRIEAEINQVESELDGLMRFQAERTVY